LQTKSLFEFDRKEVLLSLMVLGASTALTTLLGWIAASIISPLFAYIAFKIIKPSGKASGAEWSCRICGQKLTWIPQLSRYYCQPCQMYPPTCPKCGKDLSWVRQYDRFYCNICREYMEPQEKPERVPARKRRSTRTRKAVS